MSKHGKELILLIIPVLHFILGTLLHLDYGIFYQRSTDPEYFHLLNGINVALFNLATPYIDHPGTPLQVLVAISAWPVSMFYPGFIVDNVIDHPEEFITAAVILMNIVIAGVLFIAGNKVYRYTRVIWMALLIQIIPLGNIHALTAFARLTPESFMIVPVVLLCVIMVKKLNADNPEISTLEINQLAAIAGLGMAIKFSYFPLILVPVFLLSKTIKVAKYGVLSAAYTLLFAFPILFNLNKAYNWFGKMLISDGQWGSGSSSFINWADVPQNLLLLVKVKYFFIVILIVLFLVTIYSTILKKKGTQVLNKISWGLISGIVLFIFLITKHFAYHYYFPVLLLQSIIIILLLEYINRLKVLRLGIKPLTAVGFIIFVGYILFQVPQFSRMYNHLHIKMGEYEEFSEEVQRKADQNIPVIITSNYKGCPFPEKALNDGYLLCGNLKITFSEKLIKEYPNSVFYVSWSNNFYKWDVFLDADNFIDPETGVYIFIGHGSEKNYKIILERIRSGFPEYTVIAEIIAELKSPNDVFYKITFQNKESVN